jgi:ubiquinone/menaquinone biosynthesis C-methylase UbiE
MLNGFNKIARFYDALARLVFGKELVRSQKHFLPLIPNKSRVLILGGGTGWILPELLRHAPDSDLLYIEASSVMLERAKSHVVGHHCGRIQFVHGTEMNIPQVSCFDVVITNCYFDLFSNTQLQELIPVVHNTLVKGGYWFATDFVSSGKWWYRPVLTVMYSFFRLTARVKVSKLPDWHALLLIAGLKQEAAFRFFHGFILSVVFRKQ